MDTDRPYKEEVQTLFRLQKYGIKFGLSKTENLLKAFGNPHKGQNYIHIAGSNGKGSVGAFLAAILQEAGYRVGFYTSPHLVRFTERFKINGREMPRDTAAGLIKELKEAFALEEPPTFFEATTAMALIYFAREGTDLAIMEVGMGGRLDATNVISPLVSVITNISMEHEAFLGDRLLDIAKEKGGVIKEGIDVITGARQPEVVALFERLAAEKKAPLWRIGRDIRYRTTASGLHYYGLNERHKGLKLGLMGRFQARNGAIALGVTEILKEKGLPVSSGHIRKGLEECTWPGRLQLVAKSPLIILDGAHNPAAMRALARSITQGFTYRRLILVIGIMEDKDIGQVLRAILPWTDYVIYTRPVYPRAADPQRLKAAAGDQEKTGEVVSHLFQALDRARGVAGPEDLILVTGSLFTVGESMTYFYPEKYRPEDL